MVGAGNGSRTNAVRLYMAFVARRRLLAAVCGSAFTLWASQPWTKDPSKWTQAEVQKVLTDSPWAQQGTASFGRPLEPDDMPVTPPPGAQGGGMAGGRGVSDGRWDGGVARNTGIGDVPSLPVTVRWDTALPVRQALARSPNATPAAASVGRDYVITVIGLVAASTASPDNEQQGFIANSRLMPRGKTAIVPEEVKIDAATGAVHLFFPRTEQIGMGDREVTFTTRFGAISVQKKFRLKEMIYKGQLEL